MAITLSGISLVTTDPAPILHHFPILTPGIIIDPAPIKVPSPTSTSPQRFTPGAICTKS